MRSRPIGYDEFRQRVRRFHRDRLLREVAALAAEVTHQAFGRAPAYTIPKPVSEFALAGVARTSLMYGNNHRTATPNVDDLGKLCWSLIHVRDPALAQSSGIDRLRGLLDRIGYEQFGFQQPAMEEIGRTLSLLVDHAPGDPSGPTQQQWTDVLGVPIEHFMRIGFGLHVAMLSNGGAVARSTLAMDHVQPVFEPVDAAQLTSVIDSFFARTPEEHRSVALKLDRRGYEKWSPNPLQSAPLIDLAGDLVGPAPRYLIDRVSPSGLYFIGLDAFGARFTDSLGLMFQRYVGTQLNLLKHASVQPEVSFSSSSSRRDTIDWFVVFDDLVLLVEVKASRPVLTTRTGAEGADDDFAAKVGKAIEQLEVTHDLLVNGLPELDHIPRDRPIMGLVVTLEPWHFVDTILYEELVGTPKLPIAVCSAHELEVAVATLADVPDAGSRVAVALTPSGIDPPSLRSATDGLEIAANPILQSCWDRFLPGL